MVIFHSYVSLPECIHIKTIKLENILNLQYSMNIPSIVHDLQKIWFSMA